MQPMHSRLLQRRGARAAARGASAGVRAPPRPSLRSNNTAAAAANTTTAETVNEAMQRAERMQAWLASQLEEETPSTPPLLLRPSRLQAPDEVAGVARVGVVATADAAPGTLLLQLPESLAVTAVDAAAHPLVGAAAEGRGELVALALWLLAERAAGDRSPWSPLLAALPPAVTTSPLLWPDAERAELLRGSPTLGEARAREAAIRAEWATLSSSGAIDTAGRFDPAVFNEDAFLAAFSVVLAHAVYLPSAGCLALLPLACLAGRTGNGDGVDVDYDADAGAVRVVAGAGAALKDGDELRLNDARPNGEALLSFGTVQDGNAADCLLFPASLIEADKYFLMKEQVLGSLGYSAAETFPVYADRFPLQLLSYLRLSRVQDVGLLAKVSFESDVIISQMNEYEVLQLLMGDCRERLNDYRGTLEEAQKELQAPPGRQGALVGRARLAARLCAAEMSILARTTDAVRRRLAPIRGIPTKSGGMTDPNADFKEIFEVIESIPAAPAKLFDGLRRWAKGEFDPDWK